MNAWQYILASLRQYRRVHWAVAAGVAVATAVITGALLVGDSVRGSLKDLALAGLGRVDAVLIAEQPFREALAQEWRADPTVRELIADAVPLLLTPGSLSYDAAEGEVRRATRLQIIGVPPAFWSLADAPATPPIVTRRDIALTEALAHELGAAVGDRVLLRLPVAGSVPADSTLGKKDEASVSRLLKVSAILPDDGSNMARFGLRPSPTPPRNAFVPLESLQDLIDLPGRSNAIALAPLPSAVASPLDEAALASVKQALRPQLEDFGVKVEAAGPGETSARRYVRISADRLVLPSAVFDAAERLYGKRGLQPAITYLANSISAGERRIPYSTVAGVDSTAQLGPLLDEAGQPISLADDEVALNDWAAEDLGVEIGDTISLRWYDPETTHGLLHEHAPLELKLKAIVPLASADGVPTAAADPDFAPELPGVTDQASIDAWDLPFELVEKIRDKDDEYWEKHRTTPKAFVSHALATRLWSTRWGTDSVLRVPLESGVTADSVAEALQKQLLPAEMGMMLLPVKQQALAASAGTTPFDGLFLGFSFFLMASAVMLVALLFRLGIERRAPEVGLLLAVGMAPRRLRRLLLGEAAIVAACGAAIGVVAGAAYARLMVHGLNTWWSDALAAPFLWFHARPQSWAIGFAVGLLIALATMAWSLRRFARLPARQLMAGDCEFAGSTRAAATWSHTYLPLACIALAVGLGVFAAKLEGEAQAGAFFGGGALVLIGLLAAVRGKLRESVLRTPTSLTLAGLAVRNARRNPSRTMLSLALAATASFLIVALSAFRLAPTDRGTGGFDLLATADLPLLYDLSSDEGRRELGFSDADNERLGDCEIVGFRVRDGEDASCLNLYQTTHPRVLGAPTERLAEGDRFAWATIASGGDSSAWPLLNANLGDDSVDLPIVPMVLDRNTAMYSLKLYKVGDRLTIRDAADRAVELQVFGLLANSVLQGDVVIGEQNFLRLFPETAGQRFFLIRRGAGAPSVDELASLLETQLEDFGFDAVDARVRLAELLAVQNTYLSTFQSLGALGLLLGMVGLAVAQLRSVQERRGELALLQAAGFARRRLSAMVLAENLSLLAGGLAIGSLAALAAVVPQALVEQVGAPWVTLVVLLASVALAGAAAARLAAGAALRAPLIPALRGD